MFGVPPPDAAVACSVAAVACSVAAYTCVGAPPLIVSAYKTCKGGYSACVCCGPPLIVSAHVFGVPPPFNRHLHAAGVPKKKTGSTGVWRKLWDQTLPGVPPLAVVNQQ